MSHNLLQSLGQDDIEQSKRKLKHLELPEISDKVNLFSSVAEKEALDLAERKKGVVYLSHLPPGMSLPKVQDSIRQYGEIGRIYLVPRPKNLGGGYTEGWVEFMDKSKAKSTAAILNARPIGGKRKSPWRDDVWTMKYLHKFKWDNLTQAHADFAAAHKAKLREELQTSRAEERDYLQRAQLAKKVQRKRQKQAETDKPDKSDATLQPVFKQRGVKTASEKVDPDVASVLAKLI